MYHEMWQQPAENVSRMSVEYCKCEMKNVNKMKGGVRRNDEMVSDSNVKMNVSNTSEKCVDGKMYQIRRGNDVMYRRVTK